MKPKKTTKRKKDIVLKTEKSFEELIDDAFNDKVLKKESIGRHLILTATGGGKKSPTKKSKKKP